MSDAVPVRATLTVPPAPGTVADPLAVDVPLSAVTFRVAPPQVEGIAPTVTLEMVATVSTGVTVMTAVVHLGVATLAKPRPPEEKASDAAAPKLAAAAVPNTVVAMACHHLLIVVSRAIRRGDRVHDGDHSRQTGQPLMTTETPVIEVALTAGEKVAAKLVPVAGVVPVASPSEALAAPVRVIRYALL